MAFSLPACQSFVSGQKSFNPEQIKLVKSIGRPILVIQVKKYAEKKPKNKAKLIDFVAVVENYSANQLTLKDFVELSKKVGLDSDWALVMNSIYDSYKDRLMNLTENEKVQKFKSYVLGIVNDAILLAEFQK